MKERWLNWRELVIESRDLSYGAKGMALYLNTYMNNKNDFAFPGQATIAGEMGCSEKTVRKYLDELTRKGWLNTVKRFHTSSKYYVSIPKSALKLLEESTISPDSQPGKITGSLEVKR